MTATWIGMRSSLTPIRPLAIGPRYVFGHCAIICFNDKLQMRDDRQRVGRTTIRGVSVSQGLRNADAQRATPDDALCARRWVFARLTRPRSAV